MLWNTGIRRVALWTIGVLAAFGSCSAALAQDATQKAEKVETIFADFNGNDYGDWKVEGSAFGDAPAKGTLPGQMQVSGFIGDGLVNSFYGGDKATGKMTSPEFQIARDYINFLIAQLSERNLRTRSHCSCIFHLTGNIKHRYAISPLTKQTIHAVQSARACCNINNS